MSFSDDSEYRSRKSPTKVILDTDMGNDIDDALALGVLHALQTHGECEILAVLVNKANPFAPKFVDVINTFYGRGEIPIGWVGHGGKTTDPGRFAQVVSEKQVGGRYVYDTTHSDQDYGCPVDLLRRTLAAEDDGEVVVVSIGFLTNLAALLETPGDVYSPLTGKELVRQKVRTLSIMAGDFSPEALSTPSEKYKEYNIYTDVVPAQKVVSDWPGTLVFCGYELGMSVLFPGQCIEDDFSWTDHHPIADAYRLFLPMPYDRPTWDLISSLYSVRPDSDYFTLSKPGRVEISDSGYNTFVPDDSGCHYYLTANASQRRTMKELFVQLCSQPVCHQTEPA